MAQPKPITEEERQRLRVAYEELPKTPHGAATANRHGDVLPEWVIYVLENPLAEWEERNHRGEHVRITVGSSPECMQWIKLVFVGTENDLKLLSAYQDRRLEAWFGGRPWQNA
ncbi:MAG: hypothetical protein F4X65_07420 [Chloroflexi bacterium]|nr:hypothetical protein [Chloroflexota bacterium]